MADMNAQLMALIYSKMVAMLNVGPNVAVPGHSFLVLSNPGTFLDPAFDLKKADNQYLWASLLNRVPAASFLLQETGTNMMSLFDTILTYKELPVIKLKPAQQQELDAALNVVFTTDGDPSKKLLDYWTYQEQYYDALTAFQEAQTNAYNRGTPVSPAVRAALQRAKQKFDTMGHRAEVEKALATINNLQDLDPNGWWQKLRDRFDRNQSQNSAGEAFPLTYTNPDYPALFQSSGWSEYSFNQEDFENQERTKSVETGGGVSVNWGLWRASAEASYKRDEGYTRTKAQKIDISVELLRVSIIRPWFDSLVLRSRAWRWALGSPFRELISNGADASIGQTPDGVMPLLPTTLVLARNLSITADFSEEESSWVDTQLETKASVGYGPFSINGHYNQSDHEKESKGTKAGNTITNADVQILGLFCEVLALSPNPDPQLPWPTDLTLAHLPEYDPVRRRVATPRRVRLAKLAELELVGR